MNALIENSTMARLAEANFPPEDFAGLPTVHPDDLADLYWQLHTTGGSVETTYPPAGHHA